MQDIEKFQQDYIEKKKIELPESFYTSVWNDKVTLLEDFITWDSIHYCTYEAICYLKDKDSSIQILESCTKDFFNGKIEGNYIINSTFAPIFALWTHVLVLDKKLSDSELQVNLKGGSYIFLSKYINSSQFLEKSRLIKEFAGN